jgi:hypothetical protein
MVEISRYGCSDRRRIKRWPTAPVAPRIPRERISYTYQIISTTRRFIFIYKHATRKYHSRRPRRDIKRKREKDKVHTYRIAFSALSDNSR